MDDRRTSNRWVVGFDGSPESRVALAWAERHASSRNAQLDVVHARHEPLADRLVGALTGERAEAGTATGASDAVDRVQTDDDVEYRVVDGSPRHVLVDAARGASLLVVGRHGAGGDWRHTLGSVSRYCVSHSPVPTVVVPTAWHADPAGCVIVGFDGSTPSGHALRWADDFVPADGDLRALIAIEVAPWLGEELVRIRLGDDVDAEEQRLRRLLDTADPSGRFQPEIVIGDARPALAHAAERAALVVLGAHGAGRHGSALLGSVAGWMLEGSPTPVVVVPEPVGD